MSFITSPGVIVPPLTAGGVAYGTGSQAKVNSAGTAGQVLTSAGAGVPTWTTPASITYPITVPNGGTGLTTLTQNNVILGNAASTPTFVAPGASGNVLQSNGTTWASATPAVVVSGLTLITTLTASTSASLTFTNTSLTSTYDNYLFVISSLRASTGNSALFLQTSTNNGSTFATTSGDYAYAWEALDVATGSAQYQASTTDTALKIGYLINLGRVGNVPEASLNAEIYLLNLLISADITQIVGQGTSYGTSRSTTAFGGGSRTTAQANNAIKFFFDSGNIASGTIQIFGVQK